ncbi:Phytochrome-like protein cph2 [Planctomycetes bacterium Pan216]|uniref:diguanylate cyclase n=1 Tax=Kolteria novifilia TaxID=2527975 RepID=A0A518B734_9BACT|nr:Phytochrome-like protein cph2 [Planctomycetes bacterium Pan216]
MKALIADDDALFRVLIGVVLKQRGHEVFETDNGDDALELIEREKCGIVLTDWMMPGLDGLELCRRIRSSEEFRHIYIIMITANEGAESFLHGMDAGADDFISKPINHPELVARIRVAERLVDLHEDMRALNLRLENLAQTDGLTGLANRRLLDQRLDHDWRLAGRTLMPISVVMCDIDYFKRLNDSAGHLAGDQCLQAVAEELRATAKRTTDLAARYGGEEFALLLPNTPYEQGVQLAETFRQRVLDRRIPHPDSPVGPHVSVSIGVAAPAISPEGDAKDFLRTADSALYRAKMSGRNSVEGSLH